MQEEARKEVLSVVGRDGSIDDAALQKMPFIKACFKESVRYVCVCVCVCVCVFVGCGETIAIVTTTCSVFLLR